MRVPSREPTVGVCKRARAARYLWCGTGFAVALLCALWGGAAGSAIVPVPPGKLRGDRQGRPVCAQ